jgi:GT2 family glycosyltransferase
VKDENNITASIVLYKEDMKTLQAAIDSFLGSPSSKKLFLIDNSPQDSISNQINDSRVQYVFTGKNLGFGKAHNLCIDLLKEESSKFHLILNPDVRFESSVLETLATELKSNPNLAMIAPKVLFPNKGLQYTARKFPKILELMMRFLGVSNTFTKKQEYRDQDLEIPFYPDFIHGNFLLFKTEDFLSLGGFDEHFFMYMEDVDICKRLDRMGKRKMYFPKATIYHEFRKGSSKKIKLFLIHLQSLLRYYKKWGF